METVNGDITTVPNVGVQLIINGCNLQGLMGFGVSGALKRKWPIVWWRYRNWIRSSEVSLGDIQVVKVESNVWVINAVTQDRYRGNLPKRERSRKILADYNAIAVAFDTLSSLLATRFKEQTVILNTPSIGCGLANGDWDTVEEIITHNVKGNIVLRHWVL